MSLIRLVLMNGQVDGFADCMARHPEWLPEIHTLIAFPFLPAIDRGHVWPIPFASWMLDSGAYSVYTRGETIALPAYIAECRRRQEMSSRLVEIISLDVIGDWKASLRNTEIMWRAGIEAVPVYHYGEPWDVLKGLARDYPMVGVGGYVFNNSLRPRMEYTAEVFARVWPAKIHGLGLTSFPVQRAFPFWSVDASSWVSPYRWGTYRSLNNADLRAPRQHARVDGEVLHLLKEQRLLQNQWRKELSRFSSPVTTPFSAEVVAS